MIMYNDIKKVDFIYNVSCETLLLRLEGISLRSSNPTW